MFGRFGIKLFKESVLSGKRVKGVLWLGYSFIFWI